MLRVALVVVLALGVLGFAASRYLLGRTPVPATSDYALDLAEIRRLAASIPGPKAVRVNHEQVGLGSLPQGALFAGESLRTQHPMSHGAYQVVFPDGWLVIDSAFDEPSFHQLNPGTPYDAKAYEAIQRALAGARWIVITHEHPDHIGGIAHAAKPEALVGRLQLTREQLANDEQLKSAGFPEDLRRALTPLVYDKYHALAPGVVLVKAAGHTPGSQLVFVQLANGQELLFIGDVAWHMDQIRQLWYRPRLVTDFFLGEDRQAVLAEFRTLHDLDEHQPIQVIVNHDVDQRHRLVEKGLLGTHFEF